MKKAIRILISGAVGIVLVFGVLFLALANYYSDCFPVNTWINGVYCTGKTVEEVNSELKEIYEASVVTITDANRAYWELDMSGAQIEPDYEKELQSLFDDMSHWYCKLCCGFDIQIQPDCFTYDSTKLMQWLEQTRLVDEERSLPYGVMIRCEEGVYSLYDGNQNRLDVNAVYEALTSALESGMTNIALQEYDCYRNVEDSEADLAQRELWKKLNDFADCKLVYDMGTEQIEITPQTVISFLKREQTVSGSYDNMGENVTFLLDEKGCFVPDEEAVNAWVDALVEQYNTCGTTRTFKSTRGDSVEVTYEKYGTKLDGEAEKAYLLQALSQKRTKVEIHVPAYIQEGFVRGLDDIGDTYIEIDLTEQKMYYYSEGVLTLETDVVTGDVRDNMETPEGINYVYNKQRNRTLRGPGYASFVKYWMPVIGGVGIHDAAWRYRFGGEIYKINGSHGCINTPSDIMDDFYEAVKVGTPVIMFY